MRKSIALSLAAHAALLGLGLALVRRDPPPKPKSSFVVQVEGTSKQGARGATGQSTRTASKTRKRINLGFVAKSGHASAGANGTSHTQPGGSGSNQDGYDVATGMGLEREGQLYPFFDALWRRVEAATTYPDDFVQQRIQGKVTVQLAVDRKGVFTGEVKAVNGAEPTLNAFVLATLVHALRSPLPQQLWMKEDRMLAVFEFDFGLFGRGQGARDTRERSLPHFKNVLTVQRDAFVEPALNQAIVRFYERYVPPIIPIPGGFFIDFVRVYQVYTQLTSPTPDPDQLRTERLQMKKEEWESVIRKRTLDAS